MPVPYPGPMGPVIRQLRMVRREAGKTTTREPHGVIVVNNTGSEVGYGDVVCIDTASERSVVFAPALGAPGPLVVYAGGEDGQNIKCCYMTVVMTLTCDGDAVIPGDLIVASATNKYGAKITTGALQGVLGTALTSKGAGTATVEVLLSPSGFGYLSTIPTVLNNWTRDAINGKLYPATITDKVGIGASPDVWFHISTINAEARIETPNTSDPTLSFKTTNTAHQIDMYLDEDAAINLLSIGDALFADGTNRRVGIGYETAPNVTLGLLDNGADTRIRLTADANQHALITFTPDSGGGDAFSIGYDDVSDVLSLTDSAFPSASGRGINITQGALVGIGTKTVPHGGVGGATLAIEGANGSLLGPHIQLTTISDDYPIATLWAWTHNNVALFFDMYYDGAFKSSDIGSNLQMRKNADHWRTSFASGVAAGGAIGAFTLGIDLDLSNGHVGYGIVPLTNLHLYEDNADTEPAFRIEQDGAGDAAIRYLFTGGQSWSMGMDNSIAGDPFVIAAGANLQTSPWFNISPAGVTLIGDVDGSDYAKIEADGTLEMNGAAMVFNDLQFAISNAKVPAANAPTWETFTANTSEYGFSVNDYIDTQANETPHSWKLGEAGHVHVHIATKAANSTGANRFAKFTVLVAYADIGETWQESSFTAELTIPDGTAALEQFYLNMGDLTLTGFVEEAEIRCRITRIAATGGVEYAGNIFITQVGIHLEEDTIGSRTELNK